MAQWVTHLWVADEVLKQLPENLAAKVHFLENDCKDIWEWSEKVYEFAREIV